MTDEQLYVRVRDLLGEEAWLFARCSTSGRLVSWPGVFASVVTAAPDRSMFNWVVYERFDAMLLAVVLREAQGRDAVATSLQASPSGAKVYTALGYRSLGSMGMWEKRSALLNRIPGRVVGQNEAAASAVFSALKQHGIMGSDGLKNAPYSDFSID